MNGKYQPEVREDRIQFFMLYKEEKVILERLNREIHLYLLMDFFRAVVLQNIEQGMFSEVEKSIDQRQILELIFLFFHDPSSLVQHREYGLLFYRHPRIFVTDPKRNVHHF